MGKWEISARGGFLTSRTKCHASQIFLTVVKGRWFRLTPIKDSLAVAHFTNHTTGHTRQFVTEPTIIWTVDAEDGTKKRNTRNGSAPTSRRKHSSGKTGK